MPTPRTLSIGNVYRLDNEAGDRVNIAPHNVYGPGWSMPAEALNFLAGRPLDEERKVGERFTFAVVPGPET